ncbi:MAG TPA: phosphoribosylaminoimidazolesuccinocarboxamide synthase [Coxiellaceae bacterium]|nr:phosphoribosylaminoimidazolesuccinocarboxamide synthase [Coxiellaceae bacterium]
MQKGKLLYTGKAKSLYETQDPHFLIAEFRDDTTAFDGVKHEQLLHKGAVNCRINACLMSLLNQNEIPTHFESLLSSTEAIVKRLTMVPVECVIRNIAAGSLCRRLGIPAKQVLNPPLFELFLKNDALHDPLINAQHAIQFGWATEDQLKTMQTLTYKINALLIPLFEKGGMTLVDAKYEFGVGREGRIYLGDEISPDSFRAWDKASGESLDKDRFRQDLGRVIESYEIIAERIHAE